jgi:vacuolar-type H+-ATPase subunit F/Vma7
VTRRTVVALGEAALVEGYRLAGVEVCAVETADDARRIWGALPDGTSVVILTSRAASAVGSQLTDPASPLTVVMPS